MVTVPVLLVSPAAMLSVVPLCVKSSAAAFAPADDDTVTVVASFVAWLSVAVTAARRSDACADASSLISPRDSDSVTVGASSSSALVPDTVRDRLL